MPAERRRERRRPEGMPELLWLLQTAPDSNVWLAIDVLYRQLHPRLLLFARGFCRDFASAEDVVHDAMMKVGRLACKRRVKSKSIEQFSSLCCQTIRTL